MCDFSQYGGASDELTKLLATLPAPPELSVEDMKRTTNQGREDVSTKEMEQLSPKVKIRDHTITARDGYPIQARTYRPRSINVDKELPVYIHFHGGGFLFGTLDSEDATCSRIALNAEVVVLNVNYRHTPQWTYPTPWQDSEDAFEWAFANAGSFGGDESRIIVGGVSAGGQLAAALAQTKKREGSPSYLSLEGQVLMIPCLVHEECYEPQMRRMRDPSISSLKENESAPILSMTRIRMFNSLLHKNTPDVDDRRVNVGNASPEEVKGLPPTTFGIAGLDPLRDEAILYAKLLTDNGVPTNVHLFKGVPHGFRRLGAKLSASARWDTVMYDGIRWALGQPKASDEMVVHVH